MSQFHNSQQSPLFLVLDSSKATYVSEDGSTAKFDLGGTDLDLSMNKETTTASVNLFEFQCANTIYNIDFSCNILEIFVQYLDVNGNPQPYSPIFLTIPVGNYDDITLVHAINKSFKDLSLVSNTDTVSSLKYVRGFGNYISTTVTDQNEALIRDFTLTNENTKIYNTGKFKFCASSLNGLKSTTVNAGHTHYYGGFYIVTNTHFRLPELLGFPIKKAQPIPLQSEKEGFGITLQMHKTESQVTYTVNQKTIFFSNQLFSFVELDTQNFGSSSIPTMLCPGPPRLDYPRDLYICVDNIHTRNRCANPNIPGNSLLAKIPFTATFGDVFHYQPNDSSNYEFFIQNLKLDSFTVRIYDEEGDTVLWNGSHWTLIIHIRYFTDTGSAGFEDASMGRDYRPVLHREYHDSLQTIKDHKKSKRIL